jgi:hypothetical protein
MCDLPWNVPEDQVQVRLIIRISKRSRKLGSVLRKCVEKAG